MSLLRRLSLLLTSLLPSRFRRELAGRRLAKLETKIARSPERMDFRRERGVLLFRERRFIEAAKEFTVWARGAPENAESLFFLARALVRLGMGEHAQTALRLALSRDPALPRALRLQKTLSPGDAPEENTSDAVGPQERSTSRYGADEADPGYGARRADDSPRPPSIREIALDRVDAAIAFIAFEKALVLRQFAIQAEKNMMAAFRVPMMLFVFVFTHVVLFYLLGRPFAGDISYLSAVLGAFLIWHAFRASYRAASNANFKRPFNKNNNVKWIHVFLADIVWDVTMLLTAACFTELFCHLTLPRAMTGDFKTPNLLPLAITVSLSVLSGAGLGMIIHSLNARWPAVAAVDHLLTWILYLSTGVYGSYVSTPQLLSAYFKLNPFLTLVEYTRWGLDASYPVGDLTLVYSLWWAACLFTFGMALRKWERDGDAAPEDADGATGLEAV
jgi:ABC-type polysaccharide/polyol phosphate export permease